MATFSGSEAVASGFRLIKAHPQAVLLWGAVYTLLCWLPGALVMLSIWPDMAALQEASQASGADAREILAMQTKVVGPMLLALPFSLLGMTLIFGAILRAVLTPAETARGYLRLGRPEWMMLLSFATLLVLLWFAMVFVVAILGIAFGLTAVTGEGQSPGGGAVLLGVLAVTAAGAALVWLAVRLSLAPALSFDKAKFQLFESWPLTRGQAGKIFLTYLAVLVIVALIELFLFGGLALVGLVVGWDLSSVFGGLMNGPEYDQVANPARFLIINGALNLLVAIIAYPLSYAPVATIYRSLSRAPA